MARKSHHYSYSLVSCLTFARTTIAPSQVIATTRLTEWTYASSQRHYQMQQTCSISVTPRTFSNFVNDCHPPNKSQQYPRPSIGSHHLVYFHHNHSHTLHRLHNSHSPLHHIHMKYYWKNLANNTMDKIPCGFSTHPITCAWRLV